jgi:hypothetical protein
MACQLVFLGRERRLQSNLILPPLVGWEIHDLEHKSCSIVMLMVLTLVQYSVLVMPSIY